MVNPNNNIPKITTRQTEYLRDQYPSLSHLEAGNVAMWLQERKDQLFEQALAVEAEADTARVLGIVAAGVGTVCYAINPFMLVGGMIGGAAWLWTVVEHFNRTKEIAPLPFVRGNFLDALARAGDFDARQDHQVNHLGDTIKFLPRHDAIEYTFLFTNFETVDEYLVQVEPGKRFYAYRWLLSWFEKFSGRSLPNRESLNAHLENVAVDSRVKVDEVRAIQQTVVPTFVQLPQTTIVELPKPNVVELPKPQITGALDTPKTEPSASEDIFTTFQSFASMPLDQRAKAVIDALISSGFRIDEMMGSQIIAIAGTQRGGKGTLAAILATLSKALDPGLNVQYFTAGVDVYPFSCNLTSALKYSGKDADTADGFVARDLLMFLKGLDGCEPYTHKNLLLIVDEAMRLLSLLEESQRLWAIQFLLSRFAKCGGTLIIVLHASNLTSVVGKATAGLADTFKASVNFIGCVAKSVSAGGLRKMNVASGEYFKANPENFGSPIKGGELGAVPEWLKTELHPGNGQPDPVRTLLTIFPELYSEPPAQPKNKDKLSETIQKLEASFSIEVEEPATSKLENDNSPINQPSELTSHEQQLLSWIVTRKTTGKEYDLNSANKNLDKITKPDDFDSKAEYLRYLMRQLASKKKGKLTNPNLFEPN